MNQKIWKNLQNSHDFMIFKKPLKFRKYYKTMSHNPYLDPHVTWWSGIHIHIKSCNLRSPQTRTVGWEDSAQDHGHATRRRSGRKHWWVHKSSNTVDVFQRQLDLVFGHHMMGSHVFGDGVIRFPRWFQVPKLELACILWTDKWEIGMGSYSRTWWCTIQAMFDSHRFTHHQPSI